MPALSQPALYIIGLGVMIPDHVTAQAYRAISKCSHLFSIVQEPSALWLPRDKVGHIKVKNVRDFYQDGAVRTENYEHAAQEIIKASREGLRVGYVTYGNPMAYDRVARNLVQYAGASGIPIHVVPGISSLDTIMCDLRMDLAPAIQVYEASWMVICQMVPQPDAPLLLLQVGEFGSLRAHYNTRKDGSSLTELIQYLSRFYPLSHPMSLVCSTAAEDQPSRVRHVTLSDLNLVSAEDLSGGSLYIPALQQSPPGKEALKRMEEK